MLLPPESLEQLKCSICEQILSLFPIYTTKTDDNQLLSVCGRCQLPDDEKYLRNEIYETAVKTILFPCINREYGCMEDFLPEDVKQHELFCSYRQTSCVFKKKKQCNWNGNFIELMDHCKSKHNHLILDNNRFEIEMNKKYNTLNILQYKGEMFVFGHCFDHISKHFKCSIIPMGFNKRTTKYYGQISLKTEKCTLIHDLPDIDFNGNDSKSLDINIENIVSNVTNTIMLTGIIKIAATEEELRLSHDYCTKTGYPSSKLKCSKCFGILYPPVYQCVPGHYGCVNCKDKYCMVVNCLNKSRVFGILSPINDILNFIQCKCEFGCESLIKGSDLKQHYETCLYKPYSCLFKNHGCRWEKHRKDIVEHILQEHKDSTIKINKIISLPIDIESNELQQYYRFLNYSGNSFKIVYQYENPHLLWRVETVDSATAEENSRCFKFEVTLFDKHNTKLLSFRESCTDLTFAGKYNINSISCVWLHVDQIKNALHDDVLSFKINILK